VGNRGYGWKRLRLSFSPSRVIISTGGAVYLIANAGTPALAQTEQKWCLNPCNRLSSNPISVLGVGNCLANPLPHSVRGFASRHDCIP
jgi:hypothetical protein